MYCKAGPLAELLQSARKARNGRSGERVEEASLLQGNQVRDDDGVHDLDGPRADTLDGWKRSAGDSESQQ